MVLEFTIKLKKTLICKGVHLVDDILLSKLCEEISLSRFRNGSGRQFLCESPSASVLESELLTLGAIKVSVCRSPVQLGAFRSHRCRHGVRLQ